ncbi:MAG: flagellar filament capping protein FliD, partial [Tumebacillaceae bacterium]
ARSDNPDAVVQLFTNVGTAGGTDRGLAVKLYDTLKDSISKLGDRAGSSMTLTDQSEMGKQITDMKNKIYEANSKLSTYEQNYYNQFAQLETMMSKAQSQGQWLQNQLGGSNGQ